MAASLQAERAQAAVTLTAIAEGVATLNGEGAIVLANPVMGELLHRPSSSLLGQRLAEVLPALGFAGEPRETWRNRRVHLDGPPACTLEASLTLVSAEGDQAAGWVLVLRDITQQQQLEDQLRDELESRATAIRAMSDLLGLDQCVGERRALGDRASVAPGGRPGLALAAPDRPARGHLHAQPRWLHLLRCRAPRAVRQSLGALC